MTSIPLISNSIKLLSLVRFWCVTLEYLVHVSYSLKEILWRSLETDSTGHSAHKSSELLKNELLTFGKNSVYVCAYVKLFRQTKFSVTMRQMCIMSGIV